MLQSLLYCARDLSIPFSSSLSASLKALPVSSQHTWASGSSPSTCRFQGEREGGCGDVGNEVRKPSRKTSVLLVCYGATEQLQAMPPSATSHPFLSCLLISV